MQKIKSVCVYCGSSPGRTPHYGDAARTLGSAIARAGMTLIYGGGVRGIMGAVAKAAADSGGQVTGIMPRFLISREGADMDPQELDDLIVTEDMHARKHMMFERSDSFVAMPGGIGTLEEIVEILTWAQLGRHKKPIVFANIHGFWNPMLTLIDHMEAEGFLHSRHLVRPVVVNEAKDIVPAILAAGRSAAGDAEGDQAVIEKM